MMLLQVLCAVVITNLQLYHVIETLQINTKVTIECDYSHMLSIKWCYLY